MRVVEKLLELLLVLSGLCHDEQPARAQTDRV